MKNFSRRGFVQNLGLLTAGLASGFSIPKTHEDNQAFTKSRSRIHFTRDGMDMNPLEYSYELQKLAEKGRIPMDNYSRGGVVAQLEEKFAELLGKESAVFMPTGTLANHIAIRKLSGSRRRVVVQADSHIYRDSGDCAATLSQLKLLPLNPGKVAFSLDDIQEVFRKTAANRVKSEIGAISIESPVRRHENAMFDYGEMKKISEFARSRGVGMHLDGARLFNACAHSGIGPKEFASLFDTVYISMYKDFNAASGAILAGSKEFTRDLYHTRRMFGGGMPEVWPFAAVPLKYADSFLDEYKIAMKNADRLFQLLDMMSEFKIETIPNGTNVFKLHVNTNEPEKFRANLLGKNIEIPPAQISFTGFNMKINVTLNRATPEEIAEKFSEALLASKS